MCQIIHEKTIMCSIRTNRIKIPTACCYEYQSVQPERKTLDMDELIRHIHAPVCGTEFISRPRIGDMIPCNITRARVSRICLCHNDLLHIRDEFHCLPKNIKTALLGINLYAFASVAHTGTDRIVPYFTVERDRTFVGFASATLHVQNKDRIGYVCAPPIQTLKIVQKIAHAYIGKRLN